MKPLPHAYKANVIGHPEHPLTTSCQNFPSIAVSPPIEFDGPGTEWSPEELLMASISNCLVLSFRVISKMSKFDWLTIECESQGVLDKVEHQIKFTKVMTKATLTVCSGSNKEKAEKLLEKAEKACFITNTLSCESFFECEIKVVD